MNVDINDNTRPASPPASPRRVERLSRLRIEAGARLALGKREVLIESDGETLEKLGMDGAAAAEQACSLPPAPALSRRWKKPRPRQVASACYKFVTPGGRILLRDYDRPPTYVLSQDLTLTHTYHGDYGYLRGVLPPGTLVYAAPVPGSGRAAVSFYELEREHALVATLPQTFHMWTTSVCRQQHAAGGGGAGRVAVVDREDTSLYIFSPEGSLERHHKLGFVPPSLNAVAAVGDWVVVAREEPAELHLFSWTAPDGDDAPVGVVSRADLGLQGEGDILGISEGEGSTVLVATGWWDVRAISLYELCT